jgi:small subunit ribosomal protein S8
MTDTVADMIIQLKNAYLAHKSEVRLPATKLREDIAHLLVSEGYLLEVQREEQKPQDFLVLKLRYVNGTPSLTNVKRISKPGQRIYVKAGKLPRVLSGHGTSLLSTSQGVVTTQQAREQNVGGEVLFSIW